MPEMSTRIYVVAVRRPFGWYRLSRMRQLQAGRETDAPCEQARPAPPLAVPAWCVSPGDFDLLLF